MARRSRWTQEQEDAEAEAGDPCVRGDYCAGRTIVIEDGRRAIHAALTYSGFCTACRTVIGECLGELPEAYDRLQAEIGEPVKRNSSVRTPLGPSLPLRADVDAVMHAIADQLQSWEERVRDVAGLSVLDTQISRRRDTAGAIRQSVVILAPRLNVLVALSREPMTRAVPVAGLAEPEAITLVDLDGRDAGEEILRLHYRARAILGEVRPQRETFDGVPCKHCEDMSLERAEPPSDPVREAMWSRCASCQHMMTLKDFRDWAAWYAGWADRAGLTCRKCVTERHDECAYERCGCLACAAGEFGRQRAGADAA